MSLKIFSTADTKDLLNLSVEHRGSQALKELFNPLKTLLRGCSSYWSSALFLNFVLVLFFKRTSKESGGEPVIVCFLISLFILPLSSTAISPSTNNRIRKDTSYDALAKKQEVLLYLHQRTLVSSEKKKNNNVD